MRLLSLFLLIFISQQQLALSASSGTRDSSHYKAVESMSSVLYKIYLNEFQRKSLNRGRGCINSTVNSIRILNTEKYFNVNYFKNQSKALFRIPRRHARQLSSSSIDDLVRLAEHERLVKIELFLVNKYNLKLSVKLCVNSKRGHRKCKTMAKSNKQFLIRLNLTKRRLDSYLVFKFSAYGLTREIFEESFSYFLIANLHDRIKCEQQLESAEPRIRRSLNEEEEEEEEDNRCRRTVQRVNFNQIFGSRNLVIQPSNYIAYRCEGSCDFKTTQYSKFATNHSTIQSLYNWLKPLSDAPCCVPVKYKPLYLLNYDINNEIVMKQHENMVVDSCGCV